MRLNYTISGVAYKKLMALHQTVTKHSTAALTPLQLVQKMMATNELVVRTRGGWMQPGEITLDDAREELEDASMDSLSLELQAVKRGFEELPIDPNSPKGIERRAHELLRAGGETQELKLVSTNIRIDASTDPPRRVQKSPKEHDELTAQLEAYSLDLRRRKPLLYIAYNRLLKEMFHAMPNELPSQRLPSGAVLANNVSRSCASGLRMNETDEDALRSLDQLGAPTSATKVFRACSRFRPKDLWLRSYCPPQVAAARRSLPFPIHLHRSTPHLSPRSNMHLTFLLPSSPPLPCLTSPNSCLVSALLLPPNSQSPYSIPSLLSRQILRAPWPLHKTVPFRTPLPL